MKNFIVKILKKLKLIEDFPGVIYNINRDITAKQKRVAIVYISSPYYEYTPDNMIFHANRLHQFVITKVFVNLGFVVDIYPVKTSNKFVNHEIKYDVVLGFGHFYKELCKYNPQAKKILLITENAPWVVRENFAKRIDYFKKRHNRSRVYTFPRLSFYTDDMFSMSDVGIAMSGTYNILRMKEKLPIIYQIDVNALCNHKECTRNHEKNKTRFVWFGSNGLIHKGVDILIDAFREMPELELDIYGAPIKEIREFSLPSNVHDCGRINVFSDEYIENVINRHSFVVSLSCSEGMMTGISTCMYSGLIPITTPETGFDDVDCNILVSDYTVESVINTIKTASQMDNGELERLSHKCMQHAKNNYSIESFASRMAAHISTIIS